jgi:hypothetical protein
VSYRDSCIHFRGVNYTTCKADINMYELTGGEHFGIARRIPCIKDNNSTVVCTSCHFPTPEEVAQHEAARAAYMQRMQEDMAIIGAAHHDPAYNVYQQGQTTVYVCELCERSARYLSPTPALASTHAQEVHGILLADIIAAKGERGAHMDATDWFQNDDRFILPDGRPLLIRSIRIARRGADRALWSDDQPRKRSRRKR